MYSNNKIPYNYSLYNNMPYSSYNNDRLIAGGGFLAPFLLGGIAGAAVAPAFYNGYGRPPYYYNNYYYPYPVYYRSNY